MYPIWLITEENRGKNKQSIIKGYSSGKRKAHFLGKKRPDFSEFLKKSYASGRVPIRMTGLDNPAWKGDNAGYSAIHKWLAVHKPKKGICQNCGKEPKTRTEYANLSGDYKRDIDDYAELCVSCHRLFDHGKITLNLYVYD